MRRVKSAGKPKARKPKRAIYEFAIERDHGEIVPRAVSGNANLWGKVRGYFSEHIKPTSHHSDIINLMRRDHNILRTHSQFFLKNGVSETVYIEHLNAFIKEIKTHACAEERALYANAQKVLDLNEETLVSEVEHKIILDLCKTLSNLKGKDFSYQELKAKSKVLCDLLEKHMKSEEDSYYLKLRMAFTADERKLLGDLYLGYIQNEGRVVPFGNEVIFEKNKVALL